VKEIEKYSKKKFFLSDFELEEKLASVNFEIKKKYERREDVFCLGE